MITTCTCLSAFISFETFELGFSSTFFSVTVVLNLGHFSIFCFHLMDTGKFLNIALYCFAQFLFPNIDIFNSNIPITQYRIFDQLLSP